MASKRRTFALSSGTSDILVHSEQKLVKIDAKWVKKILLHVLTAEQKSGELGVLFVDDNKIAMLNSTYRHKNKATDVLAFSYSSPEILGDIAISTQTAKRQASVQKHSIQNEIMFLLIHGLLHLLGYDHRKPYERKVMFQKQELHFQEYLRKNKS